MNRFFPLLLACLLFTPNVFAGSCAYSYCAGHNFADNTSYPHVEDIDVYAYNQPVGSTFQSILSTTCSTITGDRTGSPIRNEIRANTAVNVLLRAYIRIDGVTSVPAGGRYNIKLYVDGTEVGGAERFVEMMPGTSTSPMLPQGQVFNGVATNLASGPHYYEVKAQMIDGGTMKIGLAWLHAVGSPTSYPAGRVVTDASATIGSSWTQITSPITFSNNTGANIDILAQANWQFQGGTVGDRISVGFGLKPHTQSTYPSSTRNSDFEIKCPLKDGSGNCYWPTIDTARDGINMFDYMLDVAPGTWDIVLFAINRNGHTNTTVGYRELEFASFSSSVGARGEVSGGQSTNTIVVDTQTTQTQPTTSLGDSPATCGNWTLLDTITLPSTTGEYLWTASGYIDFEGRGSDGTHSDDGVWDDPDIEVTFEAITGDSSASAEFGAHRLSLPKDLHGYYLYTDAGTWGNTAGNTIKVWARKRHGTNCAVDVDKFTRSNTGNAKFRVGRRYYIFKLVPAGSCYQFNP